MPDTQKYIGFLETAPELIQEKTESLTEILYSIEDLKELNSIIEIELISEINEETDSSGKKLYSNDTLRKNELKSRLNETEEYVENSSTIISSETLCDKLKAEIQMLRDKQSNYKTILNFLGNK